MMNEPEKQADNAQQYEERLERLARGYCRFKKLALTAVAFAGVSLLLSAAMAAGLQTRFGLRPVEAREFVLRDAAGRVGARLAMDPFGARLVLYDGLGIAGAELRAQDDLSRLDLRDAHGKADATLTVVGDLPFVGLDDPSGKARARLRTSEEGPDLWLSDAAGFSASIGTTALETPANGQKSQSSAASVHLFNNKGTVIWSAP
jgi:hypothetical protein